MYNMTSKDKPPPTLGVIIRHYTKRSGPLPWIIGIVLLILVYQLYSQIASAPTRALNSEEREGHVGQPSEHLGVDLAVEKDPGNLEEKEDEEVPASSDERNEEEEYANDQEDGDGDYDQDADEEDTDSDADDAKDVGHAVRINDDNVKVLEAAGDRKIKLDDKLKKTIEDKLAKVNQEEKKLFNVHNHDLDEVDEDYIIAQQHNKDPNLMPVLPKFDPNRHIHGALPEGEVFYPSPKLFPVAEIQTPHVDRCPKDETFILIIVVTTANQTKHRTSIRRTWGNPANLQEVALRSKMSWWVVFSIGTMEDMDEFIRAEQKTYGDILQGDFPDHPTEETRKSMQALKWVAEHLPSDCRPLFVLKTECSVFVNTPLLTKWIGEHYSQSLGTYAGKLIRDDVPIRDLRSSFYVPEMDYSRNVFPSFIQGPSYLLSMDVATTMASLFRQVTAIAMEDAYIGLVAEKMNQKPENVDKFQLTARPQNLCHYLEMMFIKTGKATVHHQIFRVVNHQEEKCNGPREL